MAKKKESREIESRGSRKVDIVSGIKGGSEVSIMKDKDRRIPGGYEICL